MPCFLLKALRTALLDAVSGSGWPEMVEEWMLSEAKFELVEELALELDLGCTDGSGGGTSEKNPVVPKSWSSLAFDSGWFSSSSASGGKGLSPLLIHLTMYAARHLAYLDFCVTSSVKSPKTARESKSWAAVKNNFAVTLQSNEWDVNFITNHNQ